MIENYVAFGYVSGGYVAGNNFSLPIAGGHPLKFFVSDGTKTETLLKTEVINSLSDGEMGIVYVPESQKIMLGSGLGFVEFLGGIDINSITTNQTFIDAVKSISTINMTASIVASDGSVVANATVTQTAPTTFNVTIPQELVGTSYSIVLDGGA